MSQCQLFNFVMSPLANFLRNFCAESFSLCRVVPRGVSCWCVRHARAVPLVRLVCLVALERTAASWRHASQRHSLPPFLPLLFFFFSFLFLTQHARKLCMHAHRHVAGRKKRSRCSRKVVEDIIIEKAIPSKVFVGQVNRSEGVALESFWRRNLIVVCRRALAVVAFTCRSFPLSDFTFSMLGLTPLV